MKNCFLTPIAAILAGLLLGSVSMAQVGDRSMLGFELPPYPGLALFFGVEGKVEVEFLLRKGVIKQVRVISTELSEPSPPSNRAESRAAQEQARQFGKGNIIFSLREFYLKRKTPLLKGGDSYRVVFEYRIDQSLPANSHSYFVEYGALVIRRVVIRACAPARVTCSDSSP